MVMGARVGVTGAEVQGLSLSLGQGRPETRVSTSPELSWSGSPGGSLPDHGTRSATVLPRDKSKVPAQGWHPLCTGGEGRSERPRDPPPAGLLSRPWPAPGHARAPRPWPRCPGTCISCAGATAAAARRNSTSCLSCRWPGSQWRRSTPETPRGLCEAPGRRGAGWRERASPIPTDPVQKVGSTQGTGEG